MKKIIFLALVVFCSVLISGDVYSYCNPGTPRISNAAPIIAGDPQCMEKIKKSFNRGETITRTVYLNKGETYRAAATGCPKAGNIGISVLRYGVIIASDSDYSPKLCFTAPEGGNYTFKVKLETTMHNSSWGNVNACYYKSTSC